VGFTIHGLRQTKEGYWLSPLLAEQDIPQLHQWGVRLVLSATKLPEEALEAIRDRDIHQVDVFMGATFRHADKILQVTEKVDPNQILIHCHHGADRTGCILTFLLCVRHGWAMPDAFYSVLYKSPLDCSSLAEHLWKELGVRDRRYPEDKTVSFYSHSACGQLGGLKARWENYRKLISSTIAAIRKHNARV
jgi:hypothetical protein